MKKTEGKMKITEEAKGLLLEAIKSNDASCVLVTEMKSCCGSQLSFSITKALDRDQVETIDGVPFIIDESIKSSVFGVTIKAENGQLFIHNENQSQCGC